MKKNIYPKAILIFLLPIFLLNFLVFTLAWSPPTAPATGGNVPDFLNVSDSIQFKEGALEIRGVFQAFLVQLVPGEGAVTPTCNAAARGTMWSEEGGAGEDDELLYCRKNSSDEYVWEKVNWWVEDCSTKDIGDECGGGVVAYHDGSGGGLIAATSDQETHEIWGCSGTSISTSTAVGTGSSNTDNILSVCEELPNAASFARNHDGGGYDDWFLPSKDEANAMYNAGFDTGTTSYYMTSSESTAHEYWAHRFSDGSQLTKDKYEKKAPDRDDVRAVRAF